MAAGSGSRSSALPTPPSALLRMCQSLPAPEAMRIKELKEELDQRNYPWRGTCFEKEELVAKLIEARATPAPSPASDELAEPPEEPAKSPTSSSDSSEAQSSDGYDEAYAQAYEDAMKLKVKELRTRLAGRMLGWADLFEKEELAARLASSVARSVMFSKSGALEPFKAREVTADQLRLEISDVRTPMVVDVFATWCKGRLSRISFRIGAAHLTVCGHSLWAGGPCKLMSPQLDELAQNMGERLRVAKLDSDVHADMSTELKVHGLPTVIFYAEGKEVYRLEGMPPGKNALKELVQEYLNI